MKTRLSTDQAIAGLLNVHPDADISARERHLYREALFALVRLAKSELMMEMKANVRKLTTIPAARAREKARARNPIQRQQQFEFHQDDPHQGR